MGDRVMSVHTPIGTQCVPSGLVVGQGQVGGMRLGPFSDDLVRDVDDRDMHGPPREVDADGLPGVRVEGQRLGGPATSSRCVLLARGGDDRALGGQPGQDRRGTVGRGASTVRGPALHAGQDQPGGFISVNTSD
jgi:hypothetical protein